METANTSATMLEQENKFKFRSRRYRRRMVSCVDAHTHTHPYTHAHTNEPLLRVIFALFDCAVSLAALAHLMGVYVFRGSRTERSRHRYRRARACE